MARKDKLLFPSQVDLPIKRVCDFQIILYNRVTPYYTCRKFAALNAQREGEREEKNNNKKRR